MRAVLAGFAILALMARGAAAEPLPACDDPAILEKLADLYPKSLSDNGEFKSFQAFNEISSTDKPPQHFVDYYKSDTAAVVAVKYCEATAALTKQQTGDYQDQAYIVVLDILNTKSREHEYVPDVCSRLFFRPDEMTCLKHRPPGSAPEAEAAAKSAAATDAHANAVADIDELAEDLASPQPAAKPAPLGKMASCDDEMVVKSLTLQYSIGEPKGGSKFELFKDFQDKGFVPSPDGDITGDRRYCEVVAVLDKVETDKVYYYVQHLIYPDGKSTFVAQSCSARITSFMPDCEAFRPK